LNGVKWSSEEDMILENKYGSINVKQLCKLLPNRTHSAIVSRGIYLGLTSYSKNRDINGVRHCQLCGEELTRKHSPCRWICNTWGCPRIYEKYRWNDDKGVWVCYEWGDEAIGLNSQPPNI